MTHQGTDRETDAIPREADCPHVRSVLSRVGDKWSVLVITALRPGPRRFSELRRAAEVVSRRMLTLRGLGRDDLVARRVTPTLPPRVDDELTALGRRAVLHLDEIDGGRASHDRRRAAAPLDPSTTPHRSIPR